MSDVNWYGDKNSPPPSRSFVKKPLLPSLGLADKPFRAPAVPIKKKHVPNPSNKKPSLPPIVAPPSPMKQARGGSRGGLGRGRGGRGGGGRGREGYNGRSARWLYTNREYGRTKKADKRAPYPGRDKDTDQENDAHGGYDDESFKLLYEC